jgi:hypothetical protein
MVLMWEEDSHFIIHIGVLIMVDINEKSTKAEIIESALEYTDVLEMKVAGMEAKQTTLLMVAIIAFISGIIW